MKKLLLNLLTILMVFVFSCQKDANLSKATKELKGDYIKTLGIKPIVIDKEEEACGGLTLYCLLRQNEANPTFQLTNVATSTSITFQACSAGSATTHCPIGNQNDYSFTYINLNWFYNNPCPHKNCMALGNVYLLEEIVPSNSINCGEKVEITLVNTTVSDPTVCCLSIFRCSQRCFATAYGDGEYSNPDCPIIGLHVMPY